MEEEMASLQPKPDRWYNITLGSSFKESHSSSKVCSLRYDFIPASLDKSQPGELHKGKDNLVTVEYLNIQREKPKVTFKGVSEDYKENDAVLIFDGESFRLERLHRSVKRLRHIRIPGDSEPARPKPVEPQPPVQIERIDVETQEENKSKPNDSDVNMSIDQPIQADLDEEIADVDISDDEAQRGPSAAEALRAQVNAEEGNKRAASSSSQSDTSGSGSDTSSSESDTSDADSVLSV